MGWDGFAVAPFHRRRSADPTVPYLQISDNRPRSDSEIVEGYSTVSRPITQSDLIGSMKLGGSVVFSRSSYS